ncbi:MAG: oxygen-independent coproporphyrinogen III oxidase [Cryomorphaceae bacterium MED-G14]|nr:MAG: oxygen-independent coproporphyrinogen III oxidase [Cryomorphaceae bacterium MED-G14]|tara:strand:- start:2775 stop:4151 length:1377 start_codon:yes stop_codon:yes gene_type:complete
MLSKKELLIKYNESGPRYTSYPPATFFDSKFSNSDHERHVIESNNENPSNISIYIHIPFCPQICHFCGCTTESGYTKPFLERYVDAVIKEINHVAKKIDKKRKVTQVHWGGGTPNAISYRYIEKITNKLYDEFKFASSYEMAIECNPAHLEFRHIELLKKFGFNRISLGIQDFRDDVLEAINRKPSKHKIEDIVSKIKSEGFTGTNIDLVYGLPLQTVSSFKKTVERAIELQTERLVTFSYAHVPSVLPRQKILEKIGFPNSNDKASMYENSYKKFVSSGYISIGMDHYSLPEDEFAIALKNKNLHRNFQGYCTRETTGQVYAFGASAISQLSSAYSQNIKNAAQYIKAIETNNLAIFRGYSVTKEQKVIRDVINNLMCNYYVDFNDIAVNNEISINKLYDIIDFSYENFDEFVNDGILEISNNKINVYENGRLFTRNIAMKFDPLVKKNIGTYSKTI